MSPKPMHGLEPTTETLLYLATLDVMLIRFTDNAINRVMNEYWKYIFPPLYPDMEKATAPSYKAILNAILDKVPYSQLFPDTKIDPKNAEMPGFSDDLNLTNV